MSRVDRLPYRFSLMPRDTQAEGGVFCDVLRILKAAEKLGGSRSLQQFMQSLPPPRSIADPPKYTNSIGADVVIVSGVVVAFVNISTFDDHSGSGVSWGPGIGPGGSVGVFWYDSWDDVTSAENTIWVHGTNPFIVDFSIGDTQVGLFIGAGIGFEMGKGTLNWN